MRTNTVEKRLKEAIEHLKSDVKRISEENLRLKNQKQHFEILFKNAPIGLAIVDQSFKFLEVNECFSKINGIPVENHLGRTVHDFFPNVAEDLKTNVMEEVADGNPYTNLVRTDKNKLGDTIHWIVDFFSMDLGADGQKLLGALVKDVTDQKQTEFDLRQKINIEMLISKISSLSIRVDDLNVFQEMALDVMGELLDVSRIYIFSHNHEQGTMSNTHEWVGRGHAPQIKNLQNIEEKHTPWWMEQMKMNQVINYEHVETIPGKFERESLLNQNIKSILVVPLFVNDTYYGFMGFDECGKHRKWHENEVSLLVAASRIITGKMEKQY
jgi:PAS domain S-box-containing protein